MFQPALFRPGTGHHAQRVEKLFTLPSRLTGSGPSPVPSPVLDAAGWISGLWVAAALLGIGVFSGGTTSLVLAVVLLYGTGTSVAVLGWLACRALRMRAVRRLAAGPATPAARDFLAAAASARAEFRAALFPGGATGTPEVRRALAPSRAAAEAAPSSVLPARAEQAQTGCSAPVSRAVPRSSGKSPIRKKARPKSAAKSSATKSPASPVQDDFAQAA